MLASTAGDRATNVTIVIQFLEKLETSLEKQPIIAWAPITFAKGLAILAQPFGKEQTLIQEAEKCFMIFDQKISHKTHPRWWGLAQYGRGVCDMRAFDNGAHNRVEDAFLHLRNAVRSLQGVANNIEFANVLLYLADALSQRRRGNHAKNLASAMDNYRKVSSVLRPDSSPETWTYLQFSASRAIISDQNRSQKHLNQALKRLASAIKFLTKRNRPRLLALLQRQTSILYQRRQNGDRRQNLLRAQELVQAALKFYTNNPFLWQKLQQQHATIRQDLVRLR